MRFSAASLATAGLPAILAAIALLALVAASEVRAVTVQPGDPAPDFTLVDLDGTSHTLSDYRGKLVLLWFFGYG
jgi:cytochrome oxidase Cu insertion factor (SCO1/SenC/PrrC family)